MNIDIENLSDSEKINLLVKELTKLNEKVSDLENEKEKTFLLKFKNMVANSLVRFSTAYDFNINNDEKKGWQNLTNKIRIVFNKNTKISSVYYNSMIDSFSKISKDSKVKLIKNTNKITSLKDSFYLIGNKNTIKKLHKNFSHTLALIGFEANELYYDTAKEYFIGKDKVQENLNKELESLQFIYEDNKYKNEFLNNTDDNSKIRTIKTALWPSIAKKIKESMELTSIMSEFRVNNKYLALIDKFATKNDMASEDVINILNVDPLAFEKGHLLENKKGVLQLRENKESIMENIQRFTILAENNHALVKGLINVTEDLKDIIEKSNVKDKVEVLKEINDTKVFTDKNNYDFSYDIIKKNVINISEEEDKKKMKP